MWQLFVGCAVCTCAVWGLLLLLLLVPHCT
jgi:hypothetical protein